MNKQIFVIRTSPYDYKVADMNIYNSFNIVAKRKIDPSLKESAKEYFNKNIPSSIFQSEIVYCSPRQRSIQTAHFLQSTPFILEELIEIKFKMEEFISESAFYDNQGIPQIQQARKLFVQAMINNKIEENYNNIIHRIELFLNKLITNDYNLITVFSHGFFMKVIEAYIRNTGIKNNSHSLLTYFDGSSETFKFCEGFIFDYKNGKFQFNSYIRNKEVPYVGK